MAPIAELAATHRHPSPTRRFGTDRPRSRPPVLVAAIRHGSGQSVKVEAIHWSCWNGDLYDAIADLDANLTKAVVAMIVAHAHLAGDADDLLRKIIQ